MKLKDFDSISGKNRADQILKTVNPEDDAEPYTGYGLMVYGVTRKQLQDLLDGKLLADPDPYTQEFGTVIKLIEEEES